MQYQSFNRELPRAIMKSELIVVNERGHHIVVNEIFFAPLLLRIVPPLSSGRIDNDEFGNIFET